MKKLIFAVVICFALVTNVALAYEVTPNLDQGTKQLALSGSYDGNHPLDYQLTIQGGFGYFVIDNLEVAGVLGWQSNDVVDYLEAGALVEYNFNFGSAFVPFVGIGALYTTLEFNDNIYNDADSPDASAWLGRVYAGGKYFVDDNVAIGLSFNYDYATEAIYGDQDGGFDDYNWKMLLGVQFYFD